MKKLFTICAALTCTSAMMGQSAPKLTANNIDEVVAAMTLHEKAQLVIGSGWGSMQSATGALGNNSTTVPGAAGNTTAIPRLGIPGVVLSDGPAGLRINPTRPYDSHTYYCTHSLSAPLSPLPGTLTW